jgi:hypothetical protein
MKWFDLEYAHGSYGEQYKHIEKCINDGVPVRDLTYFEWYIQYVYSHSGNLEIYSYQGRLEEEQRATPFLLFMQGASVHGLDMGWGLSGERPDQYDILKYSKAWHNKTERTFEENTKKYLDRGTWWKETLNRTAWRGLKMTRKELIKDPLAMIDLFNHMTDKEDRENLFYFANTGWDNYMSKGHSRCV